MAEQNQKPTARHDPERDQTREDNRHHGQRDQNEERHPKAGGQEMMDNKPDAAKSKKTQKASALQVERVDNCRDEQILDRKPAKARKRT